MTNQPHLPTSDDLKAIGQRLVFFRKHVLKMDQKELGEKINFSAKTISLYENGHKAPDSRFLRVMSEMFNLNSEYVSTGKGSDQVFPKDKEKMNADVLTRLAYVEGQLIEIKALIKEVLRGKTTESTTKRTPKK